MDILYHASPLKNLSIIEPKRTISSDEYIGEFIFATSDKRLAAMYLATKGNAILLNVDGARPRIVICNNPNDYLANDKGGAIYKVSASSFVKTPQKGLEKSEMISEVAVTPIDRAVYSTSIEAMHEMGISIYFVSQITFDELVLAKDEDRIMKKLQPFKG